MQKEGAYVLSMAGVREPEDWLQSVRNDTIRQNEKQHKSANYQDYYKAMSSESIDGLRKIYAFDIYVLGYPNTPFVDFKRS